MFHSATEVLLNCEKQGISVSEFMLQEEIKKSKKDRNEIIISLKHIIEVMKASATRTLEEEVRSVSGLIGGDAKRVMEYAKSERSISGFTLTKAMAYALSTSEVNASMGRICAAPTAGASGILPACLLTMRDQYDLDDEVLIEGLLTASCVGEIIAMNATLSGAEGGCQAECGSAAAMGAAAMTSLSGGSPKQVFTAASFALINIMGLICDPVAGLVEFPCALRNASGVVNAISSADLALAGVLSLVPFDEVVEAMYRVGRQLPEALRETALGGVAITETGKKIMTQLFPQHRSDKFKGVV